MAFRRKSISLASLLIIGVAVLPQARAAWTSEQVEPAAYVDWYQVALRLDSVGQAHVTYVDWWMGSEVKYA